MHDPEFSSYQAGKSGIGSSDVTGDWVQNVRNHGAFLQGQLDAQRLAGNTPSRSRSGPIDGFGGTSFWGKIFAGSIIVAALWGGIFGASDNTDHKQRNPFVAATVAGRFTWRQALGLAEIFDSTPDNTERAAVFVMALPYEAAVAVGAFVGNAGASVF
jgi:hypothetical protein